MEHVAIKTLSSPLAVVAIQVTVSVMGHENMSKVLE